MKLLNGQCLPSCVVDVSMSLPLYTVIDPGKLWKWGRHGKSLSFSLSFVGFWVCGGSGILVDVDVGVDGEIFFFLFFSPSFFFLLLVRVSYSEGIV